MTDFDENNGFLTGHNAARRFFKEQRKKNRLSNLQISEVSVVDRPANNKKFFLMKRDTENLIHRLRGVQEELESMSEESDIVSAAVWLKRLENLNEQMDQIIHKANPDDDEDEEFNPSNYNWDEIEKEFESLSKKEQKELISKLKFLNAVITAGVEGQHYLRKLKSEGSAFWVRAYSKDPENFEIQPDGSLKFKKEIEQKIMSDSVKKDAHGGQWTTDFMGRRVYKKGGAK